MTNGSPPSKSDPPKKRGFYWAYWVTVVWVGTWVFPWFWVQEAWRGFSVRRLGVIPKDVARRKRSFLLSTVRIRSAIRCSGRQ